MLLAIKNDSFRSRQQRIPSSGIRKYCYIFMTVIVGFGHLTEKGFLLTSAPLILTPHARAFGSEPNALPTL